MTARSLSWLGAFLVAAALTASAAAAADGDLRSSFSDDGRVITDLEEGSKDFARAASVDAAGRLVVAAAEEISLRPGLARDQLDEFLAEREQQERDESFVLTVERRSQAVQRFPDLLPFRVLGRQIWL